MRKREGEKKGTEEWLLVSGKCQAVSAPRSLGHGKGGGGGIRKRIVRRKIGFRMEVDVLSVKKRAAGKDSYILC